MNIAFVSCTKLKANYLCDASEMYQESILFVTTQPMFHNI